jgi:DNA-binding response OmpR family regulator
MEILVIDRESLTNQLLMSKLGAKGHHVVIEPNKNAAFSMLAEKNFDCVMIDPAPLSEARPVVVGIWRALPRDAQRPYVLLLSKSATTEESVMAGANDVVNKPLSMQDLETKVGNAARLIDIAHWLAHEDNIHSVGGMVGKAAFYQLFLSAIDRAFRYGERSFIVFVYMTNHVDLETRMGPAAFEALVMQLTSQMTFMRRQSDVIGRLGTHDFAVLLQRPQYESEPVDAINRFSEVLDTFVRSLPDPDLAPQLELRLIDLPQGAAHAESKIPLAFHHVPAES